MNDYTRIARVIRYLHEHMADQPSLATLATVAGLSTSHFHRLFQRWAAITPKDFLQCLTLEHAKEKLRASESVLEAALAAGLSGPGRLHDLQVTLEAATPGEFKSGGRGMAIEWGYADSPFGRCSLGWNLRGICHLAFHDATEERRRVPRDLRTQWPHAVFKENGTMAREKAADIFFAREGGNGIKAFVRATPFQLKVWRALLRMPEGVLTSYGRLARVVGSPGASRAVGTACGANPIAYLIPCHRVIRETGVIKGYAWGLERKHAVLAFEAARLRKTGHRDKN